MRQPQSERDIVKLRCPKCGRHLAECKGYGRAVCRDCGSEVTYRDREERNHRSCSGLVTAS